MEGGKKSQVEKHAEEKKTAEERVSSSDSVIRNTGSENETAGNETEKERIE
jgi:hypothetical protein